MFRGRYVIASVSTSTVELKGPEFDIPIIYVKWAVQTVEKSLSGLLQVDRKGCG